MEHQHTIPRLFIYVIFILAAPLRAMVRLPSTDKERETQRGQQLAKRHTARQYCAEMCTLPSDTARAGCLPTVPVILSGWSKETKVAVPRGLPGLLYQMGNAS